MSGARTRCSAYIATSIDGYIAREDGGLDWLGRVEREGEDYGYAEHLASVDALVLGRGTYDVVRGFSEWPFAGKRVYVLTRRPFDPVRGEIAIDGEVPRVVARLARDGIAHAYVDGGIVIRQFLAAGMLAELTLSIVPIVLGSGIRLFAGDTGERALELISSRSFPGGLVQLRYRPAQ
jgi:dihydrofolate reductase